MNVLSRSNNESLFNKFQEPIKNLDKVTELKNITERLKRMVIATPSDHMFSIKDLIYNDNDRIITMTRVDKETPSKMIKIDSDQMEDDKDLSTCLANKETITFQKDFS